MVDLQKRLNRQPPPLPPEPLTAAKIDMGYRLFWTKTALPWDAERRAALAQAVAAVIAAPGFEDNLIERRFRVTGLDDQAHSGASVLALAAVLSALDAYGEDAPLGR